MREDYKLFYNYVQYYETSKIYHINISINNECAFRCACLNGHLEIAKWLLEIKPTINHVINLSEYKEILDYVKSQYKENIEGTNGWYALKILW